MKRAGNLTMSAKEFDRVEIIGRVVERRLTQRKATGRLGLSLRQVERLCRAFRKNGAAGLVSRRFGREPLNRHDAHRPLRDGEDLDLIFSWQEERKLSRNLTFQYRRVMYLVEPGPETLTLVGERCRVHEHQDGRIEVRHANKPLPCSVFFDKAPRVPQGAIVANKRLGAVLSKIQRDQQERDRQRLARRSLTIRQKNRI